MKFDAQHLATEAERLSRDSVLIHALTLIRNDAVEALIDCLPDDTTHICRLQAIAKVAEEFPMMLHRFIEALPSDE